LASEREQRRLMAIMAADVAGYGRLKGADEPGTLAQLKAHRSELIDPKISAYRGRILKSTDDAILVEFASAVDAVRCAAEVQHAMQSRNSAVAAEKRIEFRIGIHVGDVVVEGNDVRGDAVIVATALEGVATPGGTSVSAAVRDEVQEKLGVTFDYAGEQIIKGLAKPVRTFRVGLTKAGLAGLQRQRPRHGWRLVGITVAGTLVAAVLVLFLGVPANFLVETVASRFQDSSGYRLSINGGSTVKFFPSPSVTLRNIVVRDINDASAEGLFKADRLRVVLSLSDLLHGKPRVSQITISHPTVRVPLLRRRVAAAAAPAAATPAAKAAPLIDRIVVEEGSVGFYSAADRVESSIDHINLEFVPGAGDAPQPTLTGSFSAAGQTIQIALKSTVLPQHIEGQTIPIEVTLLAPGLWTQPVTAKAELRSRNQTLSVNALSGHYQDSSFNGFATVDFTATKPFVKGDVDFDQLHLLPESNRGSTPNKSILNEPWSQQAFNLDGLNFLDADLRVSASDFTLGGLHIAPVALQMTINEGVVQTKLTTAKLYGGQASGLISCDVSGSVPAETFSVKLDGVDTLPLLTDIAQFDSLEGTMQAALDLNGSGNSVRAVVSSLAGTASMQVVNGDVRGIDVAKLIHNIPNTIFNGWQQSADDKTPLSNLSAHFHFTNGVATIDDFTLSGSVVSVTATGTIDLPGKTLHVRADPRLVPAQSATGPNPNQNLNLNQGTNQSPNQSPNQNNAPQSAGFGVPVNIEGDWSAPRIAPDVGALLSDPAGALNQLKDATKGLFGGDQGNSGNSLDNLFGGIGKMLGGSSGRGRSRGLTGEGQ